LNSLLPTNNITGRPRFGARSYGVGFASFWIRNAPIRDRRGKGVSTRRRLGRRLEAALTALAACPRTADSDRKIRDGLVEQAGYALWLFVVQREACGLRKIDHVIQVYAVPKEVLARMGPLARPRVQPAKTWGLG
jgi:hypothetical protein